jgi:hypothetical protein
VTYPVDYNAHTWVDVPENTTAPPGSPDLEASTVQVMDNAIAGAYDFRAGEMFVARKDPITGFWPSGWNNDRTPIYTGGAVDQAVRPTDLALVLVVWDGPDPSPPAVASGTAGMLSGSDWRFVR